MMLLRNGKSFLPENGKIHDLLRITPPFDHSARLLVVLILYLLCQVYISTYFSDSEIFSWEYLSENLFRPSYK